MDGEVIENDTKTIVCTENILPVFGAKTPFSIELLQTCNCRQLASCNIMYIEDETFKDVSKLQYL